MSAELMINNIAFSNRRLSGQDVIAFRHSQERSDINIIVNDSEKYKSCLILLPEIALSRVSGYASHYLASTPLIKLNHHVGFADE